MEKEKRTRYVRIDHETDSNEIFTIFEEIELKAGSDMEKLLEDSNSEFIAEEEILDTNENTG